MPHCLVGYQDERRWHVVPRPTICQHVGKGDGQTDFEELGVCFVAI